MIVADFRFLEAALQAAGVIICGVGGNIGAIQIDRDAEMEIDVTLHGFEIDHAHRADVGGIADFIFLHHVASALDDSSYARFADEHVMRFFGEHEAASARERIESGFRETAELIFSVAIREEM